MQKSWSSSSAAATRAPTSPMLLLLLFGVLMAVTCPTTSEAAPIEETPIWKTIKDDLKEKQTQQQLVITAVAVLLTLMLLRYIWFQRTLSQRLGMPVMHHPPQGRSWPWIGHALNFLNHRPWDLMMQWHRQYGPIVCLPLLGSNMITIGSPELLKQVLQSQIACVKKDVPNIYRHFLVILGKGIVTSENAAWMKQRLKMSHPLRRDILKIIPRQTVTAVQHLMHKMDAAAAAGETIPLGESLRHLTLQVISGSFLSLSAKESDSTFAKLYLPIVDESNKRVWHPYRAYLFFLPFWWKYLWSVHRLNTYVAGLIRTRWQLRRQEAAAGYTKRDEDILDLVLQTYEKQECSGDNIPDVLPEADVEQFRDEMKTFMLAGHETSAAMMTWALYEVMGQERGKEQEEGAMMRDLIQEANAVFDAQKDWAKARLTDIPDTTTKLSQLLLSEASLREALRKYSVVPVVARRTIRDLRMGSYLVPAGTSVIINIQAVHLDPKIWPEPLKYDPSRFLPENADKIQPFSFLPFIAGPRNCLGQHLALLESKMVISLLVQRYKLTNAACQTIQAHEFCGANDPRHRFIVPVIPAQEIMVQVQRR